MPNINTGNLGQFTDLVKRSYLSAQETLPQVMRNAKFVKTETLPKNTGDYRRFAQNLSRTQYAGTRAEGDTSGQAKIQYGYEKDAHPYTISLEVSITKRMRDANKQTQIIGMVTDLSEICPNTMDLDLSHRLSFAWDTSYVRQANGTSTTIDTTVGDGLALIAGAHTLTGSATTYSNQITSNPAFSETALETAERSFVEGSFDNLGVKIPNMPDCIITADDPNTINEVRRLMKATANVGSDNSGTYNVYKEKYSHIVVPRLATDAQGATDSAKRRYRFLCNSRVSDMYLCVLNEPYLKTPKDGNNGEEFSSENWNYLTACDYDIAVVSGHWIRGSKGDAS